MSGYWSPAANLRCITSFLDSPLRKRRCVCLFVWLGSGTVDLKPFVSDCLFLKAKNFAGVHTTLFVLLALVGIGYTCITTRSHYEFSNVLKLICILLITLVTKHICKNTDTCVQAICYCAECRRCVCVFVIVSNNSLERLLFWSFERQKKCLRRWKLIPYPACELPVWIRWRV